jgi:hypothetical protein
MDEIAKLLLSSVLGFSAAYLPRFLATAHKLKGNRALIIVEIEQCNRMANVYKTARLPAPAYRLPTIGWSQCITQILSVTSIPHEKLAPLQDFYIQVASLNRGLDQADKQIENPERLAAEHHRNITKAENIISGYCDARNCAEGIPRWVFHI